MHNIIFLKFGLVAVCKMCLLLFVLPLLFTISSASLILSNGILRQFSSCTLSLLISLEFLHEFIDTLLSEALFIDTNSAIFFLPIYEVLLGM